MRLTPGERVALLPEIVQLTQLDSAASMVDFQLFKPTPDIVQVIDQTCTSPGKVELVLNQNLINPSLQLLEGSGSIHSTQWSRDNDSVTCWLDTNQSKLALVLLIEGIAIDTIRCKMYAKDEQTVRLKSTPRKVNFNNPF